MAPETPLRRSGDPVRAETPPRRSGDPVGAETPPRSSGDPVVLEERKPTQSPPPSPWCHRVLVHGG